MVHVSKSDLEAYRLRRPDLEHLVVENGTNPKPRRFLPEYAPGKKFQLMFVGSLANTMNRDALELFGKRFWPTLNQVAEMRVVGSSPPPAVKALCESNGWNLHANVSDGDLDSHYEQVHFSVMPFGYGEGSKLKLLEACGRGVPVLSTTAGKVGFDDLPQWIRVDDSPEGWRASLDGAHLFNLDAGVELVRFSERYSWDHLAQRFFEGAMRMKPISLDLFGKGFRP